MNIVRPETLPQPVALFCLTPGGLALARRLMDVFPMDGYTTAALETPGFRPCEGGFMTGVRRAFGCYRGLVIIGATGVAVRAIAPVLKDKLTDPAVVVLDERGQHVISLLSGHMGGGNDLARHLAALINGDPVITTATDVNHTGALDMLAKRLDGRMVDFRQAVKTVNRALVGGQPVALWWDPGLAVPDDLDMRGFIPVDHPDRLDPATQLVCVSLRETLPGIHRPYYKLVPRRVVAGIGCRRDTPPERVATLLRQHLAASNIDPLALAAIGSIDLKRDEKALLELAAAWGVPFHTFSAGQLAQWESRVPCSDFVRQITGVGNVSQTAAWQMSQGQLFGESLRGQGVTIAFGQLSGVENRC